MGGSIQAQFFGEGDKKITYEIGKDKEAQVLAISFCPTHYVDENMLEGIKMYQYSIDVKKLDEKRELSKIWEDFHLYLKKQNVQRLSISIATINHNSKKFFEDLGYKINNADNAFKKDLS